MFGDNSSSNVQTFGRDDLLAHLSKLRVAIDAESDFDDSTRQEILRHVGEAEQEAQQEQPNASLIEKSLGFAQGVIVGALSKTAAEVALIPLVEQASQMAHHLIR